MTFASNTPPVIIRSYGLRPGAAVVELLSHAYRLAPTDPESAGTHFDRGTSSSAGVPDFTLGFPEALDRIGDVRESVVEHLASIAGTGTKRHGR